jgi:hypothetical protein
MNEKGKNPKPAAWGEQKTQNNANPEVEVSYLL